MTTTEKPAYKVIGTRPIRPDGVEKVTGRALYGADTRLPGLIHAKILRSPHAHAHILSLDTSEAEKMPGVLAVVTHRDFPAAADRMEEVGENAINLKELSDLILASDKVLFRGHPIAGVAAETPYQAEAALEKIKVEYDVLPPVLDVRDAMRPESPLLSETRRTTTPNGTAGDQPSNIAAHNQFKLGDVEAALAEADFVVDREYRTKMVHQGYIEPHTATAMWNADDTIAIWTSTQGSFGVRAQISEVLKRPLGSIKVTPMEIGGGFGGKIVVYADPIVAVLSRKTGRPVQATMSRQDVFEASGPTSGTSIHVKLGVKDGLISGVKASLAYESGAYPGSPVGAGAMCMLSSYNIENVHLDTYDVTVNKPKTSAYRAPGAPAAACAMEQAVDEAARTLNVDPLAFRMKNSAREGTRMVTGVVHPVIGHEQTLQAAIDSPHYKSPIEGPNRGRGVATGFWFNAGMQSSVSVGVNPDGTVNLTEGSTDIGGTRASLAMQLAEALDVPFEDVKPAVVDTDSIGHNDVTGGSRTTFASGLAVYEAAQDVLAQMRERGAQLLGAEVDDVVYESQGVQLKSDSSKRKSFKEIAAAAAQTGGPIVGQASLNARGPGAAFATHIVDVEVDTETGKVDILRYTAVQDVGTAIHPSYVEGQIQGGAAQGIGWALNEEYIFDEEGRMLNSSFLDYRMPTSLDLPMIDTILVEVPNPSHPYGVRGVGEVPIVPPLAAIANAVAEATGRRFTELPISPRRVVEELHDLS